MIRKVTFVIRQSGTASAFIPLLEELNRHEDFVVSILAFELSHALLENSGLEFIKIDNFSDALQYLRADIDYLVTGTSEMVEDDESFWKWSNENQIPSLAFVDQWSNLAKRFDCNNLPTQIGVIDEKAKDELESFLAGRCPIQITGSPVFDSLKNNINTPYRSSNPIRILFVLEPDISGMNEDEIRSLQGFTEYDCLRAGLETTRKCAHQLKIPLSFTLKPHPRDDQMLIEGLLKRLESDVPDFPIKVCLGSKEEALIDSDIVMGMRSMLLLEAAFVHKPVISIQLNRKHPSSLTDDRKDIKVAVSEREVNLHLKSCITSPITHGEYDNKDIQGFCAIDRFMKILKGHRRHKTPMVELRAACS